MEGMCQCCRDWEEHYYRNHFEIPRFFKVLVDDFSKQLTFELCFMADSVDPSIKKNFWISHRSLYFTEELCDSVELKGPSGNTWNVRLKRNDGNMFFENGWSEFMKDHTLEEDDFLVFRYMGNACFNVIMFDSTGCEKEHSYFVKNRKKVSFNRSAPMNRERSDNSGELLSVASSHRDHEQSLEEVPHMDIPKAPPSSCFVISQCKNKVVKNSQRDGFNSLKQKARGSTSPIPPEILTIESNTKEEAEENAQSSYWSRHHEKQEEAILKHVLWNASHRPYLVSNRRCVTDAEKDRPFQLASAIKPSNPAFVSIMRPTTVYKEFKLIVPVKFVKDHLPHHNQIFLFRIPDGRTWEVHYKYYKRTSGFNQGWKKFSMDNNLEEYDTCVFELANDKNNKYIMDVQIFRVVEDIVLPTGASQADIKRLHEMAKLIRGGKLHHMPFRDQEVSRF